VGVYLASEANARQTARLSRYRGVSLLEPIKNVRKELQFDAFTGICDRDFRDGCCAVSDNCHPTHLVQ
jgi:hypothetical protein